MVKKTCGMTQLKLLFLKWEHLPELIWVLWTWQVWAKNYNLMRISKLTGSMFIRSAYSNWHLRFTFGSYQCYWNQIWTRNLKACLQYWFLQYITGYELLIYKKISLNLHFRVQWLMKNCLPVMRGKNQLGTKMGISLSNKG